MPITIAALDVNQYSERMWKEYTSDELVREASQQAHQFRTTYSATTVVRRVPKLRST